MVEEKKESKQRYLLGSVVTGTTPAIMNDGEPMTLEEALAEILNKLDKLSKSLL